MQTTCVRLMPGCLSAATSPRRWSAARGSAGFLAAGSLKGQLFFDFVGAADRAVLFQSFRVFLRSSPYLKSIATLITDKIVCSCHILPPYRLHHVPHHLRKLADRIVCSFDSSNFLCCLVSGAASRLRPRVDNRQGVPLRASLQIALGKF